METLHKTHASFLTASVIVTIAVVFGFFTGALSGKAGASYCPLSGQSNRTVVYFGDLLISDQAPGADKQILSQPALTTLPFPLMTTTMRGVLPADIIINPTNHFMSH